MPKPSYVFPDKMDALSKHGAGLLADCIMNYWMRRGYGNVRAERFAVPDTASWGVSSNLVAGRPPARGRRPSITSASHSEP